MEGAMVFDRMTDRPPLVVATAGSVDDGKSTLIGRMLYDGGLLPVDQRAAVEASGDGGLPDFAAITDGLADERAQGITIDVAWRYVDAPGRRLVIADVPGHEQYTRNMVTGASNADAVVILADARRGPTVQTWRHLCLSHLLGVRDIVVAVNKMDAVAHSEARFREIAASVAERSAPFAGARLHFVPVSARDGDNVVRGSVAMPWYDGPSLFDLLQSLPGPDRGRARGFRLPVQLVSRLSPAGDRPSRAYLGRIAAGSVAVGDEIVVLPAGRGARVAAMERLGRRVDAGAAGQSVALYLDRDLDVARGDVIAGADELPQLGATLDALLFWLGERPFDPSRRYLVRHGVRDVRARVSELRAAIDVARPARVAPPSRVGENDLVEVRLTLQSPLAFDDYRVDRAGGGFILIDEQTDETVAAGLIGRDFLSDDV